jgi:hypothetical protein
LRKLLITCVMSVATAAGVLASASTAAAAPQPEPVAQLAARTSADTWYYYGHFDTYEGCDAFGQSGLGEVARQTVDNDWGTCVSER